MINRSLLPLTRHFTEAGRDFFMRALHPNDDSRGGGVFIPDDVTIDRAISEHRPYGVITKPNGLDTGNWDVQIAILPVADMGPVYRVKASSADATKWSCFQPLPDSTSVRFGQVACAYSSSSTGTPAKLVALPSLLLQSTQFRQAFKGLTIVLNASSLNDQGYVTAGQWGNKPKEEEAPLWSGVGTPAPDYAQTVRCLIFNDVPVDESGIVSACPEAGMWEARRGIYMPMRYEDPTHIFNGGDSSEYQEQDSTVRQQMGFPICIPNQSDRWALGNDAVRTGFDTGSSTKPGDNLATTAGNINQSFGLIQFTGLADTASLVCKMRVGLEVVPDHESPDAKYAVKGPPKDQMALDAIVAVSNRLPVVYEHKYNSLGMLLPLIGKVASSVLPTVAPWLAQTIGRGAQWISDRISPRRYQEPPLD